MKTTKNELVLGYFQTLGLRPAKSIDNFWRDLKRKYPKSLIAELENIVESRAEGNQETDLYEFKNQSLSLSLDFSTWSTDLYRRFLEWFTASNIDTPTKVLDIGCDNGIITCFLAKHYPDSEFLGIDISANSIKVARELATKLELKNVTFECINAFEVQNTYGNYFDMVISVRSLHEMFEEISDSRYWSLKDFENNTTFAKKSEELSKITNTLVEAGGRLVTFERLPRDVNVASFIKLLNSTGLCLNESVSHLISFQEVGELEQMPLLVFEKKTSSIYSGEDLLRIMCNTYGKERPVIQCDSTYDGVIAEMLMENINNKKFLKGLNINFYDGSGQCRYELWKNENFVIAYDYSNIGFRSLKIISLDVENESIMELEMIKRQYSSGASCAFYTSPLENI